MIQRDRAGAGEATPHQAHQRNGRAAPDTSSTRPATPHSGHGANQRAPGAHRTRGTGAPGGDEGGHEGQRGRQAEEQATATPPSPAVGIHAADLRGTACRTDRAPHPTRPAGDWSRPGHATSAKRPGRTPTTRRRRHRYHSGVPPSTQREPPRGGQRQRRTQTTRSRRPARRRRQSGQGGRTPRLATHTRRRRKRRSEVRKQPRDTPLASRKASSQRGDLGSGAAAQPQTERQHAPTEGPPDRMAHRPPRGQQPSTATRRHKPSARPRPRARHPTTRER